MGGANRNLSRFFFVALCLAPLRFMELKDEGVTGAEQVERRPHLMSLAFCSTSQYFRLKSVHASQASRRASPLDSGPHHSSQ